MTKVKELLCNLTRALRTLTDRMNGVEEVPGRPDTQDSGRRGRPKFIIGREALEGLVGLNFSWTAIARLLGKAFIMPPTECHVVRINYYIMSLRVDSMCVSLH